MEPSTPWTLGTLASKREETCLKAGKDGNLGTSAGWCWFEQHCPRVVRSSFVLLNPFVSNFITSKVNGVTAAFGSLQRI